MKSISTVQLLCDDVAGYLRSLLNGYAAEIDPATGYTFWEGPFNAGAADKTFEEAAFLERVRNMLVMEDEETLWLAKATPRAWLAAGKKIAVRRAPTQFGAVSYEILSDADHGKITATVAMPSRSPPKAVLLRLRHPTGAPIKSATVNGKPWNQFNNDRELIELRGLTGNVAVTASY